MKGAINPGQIKDGSESPVRAFNGAQRCASVGSTDIIYNCTLSYANQTLGINAGSPHPPNGLPFGKWFLRLTLVLNLPVPVSVRIGMAQNTDSAADLNRSGGLFTATGARFLVNNGAWDKVFITIPPGVQVPAEANGPHSFWRLQQPNPVGPDLFTIAALDFSQVGTRIITQILPEQSEHCIYQFLPMLFTDSFTFPVGRNFWYPSFNGDQQVEGWSIQGLPNNLYPNNTVLGTLQFRFSRISFTPLFTWAVASLNTVSFSNKSFFNPALAPTWEWDFGDGTAHSTDKNPSHNYGSSGQWRVTLTMRDSSGGVASFNQTIIIPLVADFTYTTFPFTPGLTIFPSDRSTGAVTWDWDWGDGTPHSHSQNPISHNYTGHQTFNLTLTVGDGAGKTNSKTKPVST